MFLAWVTRYRVISLRPEIKAKQFLVREVFTEMSSIWGNTEFECGVALAPILYPLFSSSPFAE